MKLYICMWVRGQPGCEVSLEDVNANKLYAIGVATQLRDLVEPYHEIICPHQDTVLDKIDHLWLETRDSRLVPMAMERCIDLLSNCDGIIIFHRGYLSEGMQHEKKFAEDNGMFIYEAHDLCDEIKEDLVCAINEVDSP